MANTDTCQTPHPSFQVYKPPGSPAVASSGSSVFLAGSIDQGNAIDWQTIMTSSLSHLPVTVFNPRRDSWDNTWEQHIDNEQFRKQVEWELDALDSATVVAMYFDAAGMAPISLLELGLYAASGKMIVCCPEGYWRRGNVQVLCARFNILLVDTLEHLTAAVVAKLEQA
jgi:hypothetical protein